MIKLTKYASGILVLITFFSLNAFSADIPALFPQTEGKDFKKTAPVIVNGDKVEYLGDQKKIEAQGNVSVNYGDVKLTCDRITVFTETKLGMCEGNVKITQLGREFTGQMIEYNFDTKVGKIVDGNVKANPMYGRAANIDKVSDKEVILKNGYVTTCDNDKPHYRISAKEIQFFIGEKVVAKQVFLYVGDTPVMYVPYYVQPINDLKTKILLQPGYTDDWGYYVLGSYRYYLSEKAKGYLHLDYRTKKGLAEGIDYNFETEKLGEGSARVYYARQNDGLTIAPDEDDKIRDRYRISYKHKLDFSPETQGMMELNKLSDKDIVKDYFSNEMDDGWTPDNYVSIINHKNNYSFEVLTQKRLDDFFTYTEKLPELSLNVYNQKLWDTKFYYANDMSFTNFYKRYAPLDNTEDEESIRYNTYNRLSYASKLFGWLYATPYVATRQTYYSQNKWGDTNNYRQMYEYGIDFNTKFYKTMEFKDKNEGLTKVRHIVTPSIGFHTRNQPSISPDNLHQFDWIDALDTENLIALGLENKLQTKYISKDGSIAERDIMRFLIQTDYLYRFKKGDLAFKEGGKLSDIYYDLELRPLDWLYLKSRVNQYIKAWRFGDSVKQATTDLIIDCGEKFNWGVGHIYENSPGNSTSQFTTEASYKINKDWGIRVYERFDSHKNTWEEQEYTLYKDLHCWLSEYTCNIKDGGFAFWVVFRLKAFPEVPLGFKRTYRRPSISGTTTDGV